AHQLDPEDATGADAGVEAVAELVEEDFAGEGEAVGMEAGGGEADDGVAGADRFAVDDLGAVDDADDGADEVVIGTVVDAGHLGGLAADEGAAGLFAAA